MKQFCSYCGTPVEDTQNFCSKCGKPTVKSQASPPPAAEEQPADTFASKTSEVIVPMPESEMQEEVSVPHDVYIPDKNFQEMFLPSDHSSRLNRLRYFKRILAVGMVWLVVVLWLESDMVTLTTANALFIIMGYIQLLFIYWLDIRRLKDLGKGSALATFKAFCGVVALRVIWKNADYWGHIADVPPSVVIMMLALFVQHIIFLYLLFASGNKGANEYGPDPLEAEEN